MTTSKVSRRNVIGYAISLAFALGVALALGFVFGNIKVVITLPLTVVVACIGLAFVMALPHWLAETESLFAKLTGRRLTGIGSFIIAKVGLVSGFVNGLFRSSSKERQDDWQVVVVIILATALSIQFHLWLAPSFIHGPGFLAALIVSAVFWLSVWVSDIVASR